MTRDPVAAIADAVMYEGYILYPYRPSALKNRQRWTFGGLFPQGYSAEVGGDPWAARTECLIEGAPDAAVSVTVRFLHLIARQALRFDGTPGEEDEEGRFQPVAWLQIAGQTHTAWEEAGEREVALPASRLGELAESPARLPFAFDGGQERELLRDEAGAVAGAVLRTRHPLRGVAIMGASLIEPGLWRLSARVENTTPLAHETCASRALAQRAAFASTHAILRLKGGAFVSLTDPPPALAEAAKACTQEGWWPVLAGAEGARDALLASPIILYDYPQIAPESPGDLFDGAEIDEILTLRILTMTEAEKREAAQADPRARALLARTEALTAEDIARLHGVLRLPHGVSRPSLASLSAADGALCVGARVRVRPRPGGDVMDLVLDGKIAVIEAIERDFEDRVHVAVTMEDDPGRDLGLERYPGHRFFFSREELEPVAAEASP